MMGFNKVYKSLQELFPQIDSRVLKAVAIEHSKDPDEAVSVVLEEIIPFFIERSKPSSPLVRIGSIGEPSEVLLARAHHVDGQSSQVESSSELQKGEILKNQNQPYHNDVNYGHNDPFYDAYDVETKFIESVISENAIEYGSEKIAHESVRDEHVLLTDSNEVNIQYGTVSEEPETEAHLDDKSFESSVKLSSDADPFNKFEALQGMEKSSSNVGDSVNGNIPSTYHGLTMSHSESSQLVEASVMDDNNIENSEIILSVGTGNIENRNTRTGIEDSALDSNTSQPSSQINIVEMIEDMIGDARNNKKTMFSAMESVISLMKEVELKEKAVEQAKEEAATGGSDILGKVEDLKKMLQHAKDANDMHAGEVYGEKAILGTELKELQLRVFSLADQRDKSLAVLDEMRQALEVRIAVAEDEIKSAELERLEKEKDARQLLAEQELIMEKVVRESNILKKQAEENAKLEQFLLERGSVIDTLQGEIAVICQDVNLLKEKFDERVPFSKSLTSSQTSCILASTSSNSSSRNLISEQTMPDITTDAHGKTDPASGSDEVFVGEEETTGDGRKALLDEEWEIFDGSNIV